MTHPIDTAYVDIVPVDKSLEKLQRDIDKAMKKIEKEAKKDLDKIDKDFDDTFKQLNKYVDDMEKQAERHFKELDDIVENSLGDIENEFDHTFTFVHNKFTEFGDDSDKSFKKVRSKFFEPIENGFKNLGGIVFELGKAMFQLASGIGGTITSNPLVSLVIGLLPAIIALSAALSQLLGLVGLLPAGLTVLLAAIIPIVVAFQNFGDAVSAVASGDLEKMNEALAKLAPGARAVALEIGRLMPQLKALQLSTQNAFFTPLIGAFTQLGKTTLPALEVGFMRVGQAAGILVRHLIDFFSMPAQATFIDNLFRTTASLIAAFGPNLIKFLDGFVAVANAVLPTLHRLGTAFGDAFGRFGEFMSKAAADGSLQTFIDDALTTVRELFDLVKALGGLFGTLFEGTEESGHDFIQALTDMTVRLDTFLKTAEGQDVIHALVFAVQALAAILSTTLDTLIFFTKTFKQNLKFLETVGRGFVDFVKLIGTWLAKIPEFVTNFIGGIPEMVSGFFTNMFDLALGAIGVGIGLVLFNLQVLPEKIVDFFSSLPGRIFDILVTLGPLVVTALQMAVDFGKNVVVNGFNAIVDFVLSVPDRLKALIPTFGNAGHSLIQSFMNGFKSVGGFIGDVAGDIVNAVKGFLNKAIDRINSGIATIDAILPGDLGRIPRLAQGAFVPHRPGGILANVGEGREDEWVLPDSKLQSLMQGSGAITFGPNSINITFSGAVPTEGQARQVGNAVGDGILDRIAKRNLQVQVRAI